MVKVNNINTNNTEALDLKEGQAYSITTIEGNIEDVIFVKIFNNEALFIANDKEDSKIILKENLNDVVKIGESENKLGEHYRDRVNLAVIYLNKKQEVIALHEKSLENLKGAYEDKVKRLAFYE